MIDRMNADIAALRDDKWWKSLFHKAGWSGDYTTPFMKKTGYDYGNGLTYQLCVPGYGSILHFTLQRYPACCAAMLFHHFAVEEYAFNTMPKVENPLTFKEIMDVIFKHLSKGDIWMANRRLVGVFVENRRIVHTDKYDPRFEEIERVENPKMQYQPFYDYFKQMPLYKDRLFWNVNSNLVMHEFEVIFSKEISK